MLNICRLPDDCKIILENNAEITDSKVEFELSNNELKVYLTANADKPQFVVIRWNYHAETDVKVLGDKWERSYGDLEWRGLSSDVFYPWYFIADFGSQVVGCGVKVRPNSFVSFQYDSRGVTANFDVRCGASGVELGGRRLCLGTIVCENYKASAFEAAKEFCRKMCHDPILPKEKIYGSNNWYYAYGASSKEAILRDATLLAELTKENQNRPFMTIDDGWEINFCNGPWEPNSKYGDMVNIVKGFKELNVRPGIWMRPLHNSDLEKAHPEYCINRENGPTYLDPSHPKVQEYLREVIGKIKMWGFELLKHDFTTVDCFGEYANGLNGVITKYGDWHFYNKSKTSAEIILELYELIKDAADGMYILGCNTLSHLCAGLAHINRIGDDTSGRNWCRTRTMGVNTLAFRLPQHNTFYAVDADCVGILNQNIPWLLNKQWLELLAKSGTPLFVSLKPDNATNEIKAEIEEAFKINSLQNNVAEPLDWQHNKTPEKWLIDGEVCEFDWTMNSYTPPIYKTNIPG